MTSKQNINPEKKSGKNHVKQIGFKVMPADMLIINQIKSDFEVTADSDTLRISLELYADNKKLYRRLEMIENEMADMKQQTISNSWRTNSCYELLLKVAQKVGVISEVK